MARKCFAPRANLNGCCVTHDFCNASAVSDVENEKKKEVIRLDGDNEAGSGRERKNRSSITQLHPEA